MTAKEFFEHQLITDANSVIDKTAHKYSRQDLIKFAQAYGDLVYREISNKFGSLVKDSNGFITQSYEFRGVTNNMTREDAFKPIQYGVKEDAAYSYEITQKPIKMTSMIKTTIEIESGHFLSPEFVTDMSNLFKKHIK